MGSRTQCGGDVIALASSPTIHFSSLSLHDHLGTNLREVTGLVDNCVLFHDHLDKYIEVPQFCSSQFLYDDVLAEKSTSVLKFEMDNIRRKGIISVDVAIVASNFKSPPISATYGILSQVGWFIYARALALVPRKIVAVSRIPDPPANMSITA